MNAETWTVGAVALAAGLPTILLARAISARAGLVDTPDARKLHVGDVPLAGGIGVYLTVALASALALASGAMAPTPIVWAVLSLALATLMLGVTDDYRDLSARLRLALQALVALLLVLVFDIRISWLGDVLGVGSIGFERLGSLLFTVFCVVGVLNATNMMDGVDGLLAAVASVTFAAVAALATLTATPTLPTLCTIFIGALGAFLAFNLGLFGDRRRVFLGDSGSTMLGLVLASVLIAYTQSPGDPLHPVAAGWLLGLPLLDSSVVRARRLRARRSPFDAGRDHLHHRLLNLGFSPARTLVVMVALQLVMVGIGVSVQYTGVPPYVYLYGFVALVGLGFVTDLGLERAPRSAAEARMATIDAAADELSPASRSAAAGSPALSAEDSASVVAATGTRDDRSPAPVHDASGAGEARASTSRTEATRPDTARNARSARTADASADA